MPERDRIDQVQRLERRLEELAGLVQVIGKVNRSLELDDVLKVSYEGFQGVLGSDFGCFLLIQPDRRTLRLEQPTGLPPTLLARLQLLTLDPRTEATTADDQLDLLHLLGQRLRGLLTQEGTDRYALIPLSARARPVGILLASIGIDSVLMPPSIDLLMSIGEQVGMAIENARLHVSIRESEEWRTAFMENSPDAFWEGDLNGKIYYVNDAACKLLGYDREALLGMRPGNFIVDNRETAQAAMQELQQEGVLMIRDAQVRTRSGEIRIINYTTRAVRDPQGNVVRFQSISRDITEQRNLLETVHRRNQELAALNSIASILSRPLEFERSLSQVCEQIVSITGMEGIAIVMLDESRQFLYPIAHRGISENLMSQVQRLGLDDPLTRRIVEGDGFAVDDMMFFEEAGFAGPRAEGYRAGICMPIKKKGITVGVLFVGSKVQKKYEPSDLALLRNISSQIAVALENSDLYAEMQRRVQELDGLAKLSAACASSLDLQRVLDLAAERTQTLLHVDSASIRLIKDDSLYFGTVRGQPQGVDVTEEVAIDKMLQSMIGDRAPYIINDLEAETWVPQAHREILEARSARSGLVVPLVARDHVIGVLGVGNRDPHRWSKNEINLLQTIANQVANAIENAQLFQAVVSEQRKVQAIFDSGLSGLYATDAEGRIVMFNRAAERITGWTSAEVHGKKWVDLFGEMAAGVPTSPVLDEALIRKKPAFELEGRVLMIRDGRVIQVAKAAAPLLDDDGNVTGAVGAFWDLSREKAGELSRERFLRLVAHELRSPLTGLLSALQLFERPGLSKERRAQMWREVMDNAARLRKFAADFLDHEAAIRSPHPVHVEPQQVAVLARKVVRQFKGEGRGHRFRVLSCKPEPTASVDVDRLEMAIRNLLDNAVNYSPPGSLITVSISSLDDDTVEVTVQDQGDGIPLEDRERIFEPFYRSSLSVERRTYGHGLGLSIARSEVKAMGGEIWVDGKKKRGATFHITLRRTE